MKQSSEWDENLFKKEVEESVKVALKYLLDEGVILKEGSKYRIKTKNEIRRELENIFNS